MTLLILGVVLFIGAHLVPSIPSLHSSLQARVGRNRYRGLFSLVSLFGFVLLVVGMGRAPFVPVWNPPAGADRVAVWPMPVALVLLVAAFMPTIL